MTTWTAARMLSTGAAALLVMACAGTSDAPRPTGPLVERDVAVPMRDGVVLRADLVRPPGDGPFPTLVYRTPYGKTETTASEIVAKAAARGYAVVVQDVRGRYASDGVFEPYRHDGRDGHDTIEWSAAQPWSNGRVGTFGLSYPGAVQWLAALESPPHLVAMVPAMTYDRPSHFWYAGGVWDGSWLGWAWLNMAPDLRRRLGLPGATTAEAAEATWKADGPAAQMQVPRNAYRGLADVAEWYYEWMRHGPYDPWWDWADLAGKYGRVSAAVLNISGWHDEMYGPLGATTNFAELVKARGGNVAAARTQLVIGPWTHGSDWKSATVGVRDMGVAAVVDYDALVLDWMDRWVREAPNGVETQPPVRLYGMGAGAWRTGDAWPPPAERRAIYLAGQAVAGKTPGALVWEAPRAAARSTFVSDPRRPVRDPHDGAAGGLDYRALASNPGVVTFESAPLDADLEVLGPIDAEMFVSVDQPDTDLWVKLLDVAPDGTAYGLMSIGLDVLRASYRDATPERKLLQPGRVYRLDLRSLMTGNRFLAGHRLRVAVMASFAPNLSWNLHSGALELDSATAVTARVTVHSGGTQASRLVLPVSAR